MRWRSVGEYRVLDFDIENRPLAYMGDDYTSGDITAIAASFFGESKVHLWLMGADGRWHRDEYEEMLAGFRGLYDQADVVTGHYIRKHDLPVINGGLMEMQMPLLDQKLAWDTKIDLVGTRYLSLSQENLSAYYRLSHKKEHMNQAHWRTANRFLPEGIAETRRRAVGDVKQHKRLKAELSELGALKAPGLWRP